MLNVLHKLAAILGLLTVATAFFFRTIHIGATEVNIPLFLVGFVFLFLSIILAFDKHSRYGEEVGKGRIGKPVAVLIVLFFAGVALYYGVYMPFFG